MSFFIGKLRNLGYKYYALIHRQFHVSSAFLTRTADLMSICITTKPAMVPRRCFLKNSRKECLQYKHRHHPKIQVVPVLIMFYPIPEQQSIPFWKATYLFLLQLLMIYKYMDRQEEYQGDGDAAMENQNNGAPVQDHAEQAGSEGNHNGC